MTTQQHEQQKQEIIDVQKFEKENGLENSFGLWYDRKTEQHLMYLGTYPTEVVEENKVVVKLFVTARYIKGRGRMFEPKVWKQTYKGERRFKEVNDLSVIQ